MTHDNDPFNGQQRIYVEREDLLFVGAEFADNLNGIEVYLKHDNDHIGAIRYSRQKKRYHYHPDATKFMNYTAGMLTTIKDILKVADKNKKE